MLNRRLTRLRDGHSEFKALVETLTTATDKAQSSLKDLRELTENASKTLSGNIDTARKLADELSVITESGNALAERIEARLTGGPVPVGSSKTKKKPEKPAERRGGTTNPRRKRNCSACCAMCAEPSGSGWHSNRR